MDYQTARDWLNDAGDRKPSEMGEAVDVLYRELGSYEAIAKEVAPSPKRLSDLHRAFLLPEGIRWQFDKGKIRIGHVQQISRLQGGDQWLLAFTIVQEKISVKDSKEVVDAVVKKNRDLRDVLHNMIGIRFDEPVFSLLAGTTFEYRFRVSRAAWGKKLELADFCHKVIEEATRLDADQMIGELTSIVDKWRSKCGDPALKPDSGSLVPSAEEST